MLAWSRLAVFAVCGATACTFGTAGAGDGSPGDDGDGGDGSGGDPTSAAASDDPGKDDDGGVSASSSDPGGSTIGGPGTTTVDPSGESSGGDGTATATTTGGGDAFVLCDATDPDLRACYDFVDAENGTLHDLSSQGNDGTVSAEVIVDPGLFGSVVRVSDSAEILVPDSASLDILAPDMSFDAWVLIDSEPPLGERRGVFDNDGQYSMMLYGAEGMRCGYGHTNISAPVPLGQWIHVACVGSESGTVMYVDGVEVQVGNPPVDAFLENTEPIAIGDNSPQFDLPLDGEIAAVRIFSRTLSPQEVAEATAAGRP